MIRLVLPPDLANLMGIVIPSPPLVVIVVVVDNEEILELGEEAPVKPEMVTLALTAAEEMGKPEKEVAAPPPPPPTTTALAPAVSSVLILGCSKPLCSVLEEEEEEVMSEEEETATVVEEPGREGMPSEGTFKMVTLVPVILCLG